MNIAKYNSNNITTFLNLSKSEHNSGKYYNPNILSTDYNTTSREKDKTTSTLKKNFCETISNEVLNESIHNNEENYNIIDDNVNTLDKNDKTK